ncbi:thymidylate kinase [Herbihabitans rhizosphaerae]|uniref:Thymidylate kinase n=1 Tax=Herbihabitans rhizosphaerae TaxID=1872711 RepID=A0A4Q7KIW3_9PSEU|nr:dTMP kinase [Herbihabitans rhizosphaerae]RZS36355.1 thymidylate kinase [Herbihabitans rhizosphaerae]
MTQRCSDGLFVSVDGPSGAGKTTIVRHLAHLLLAQGRHVHVTAEPSSGPIGTLASELTETVTGYALACLYAADRYHHVETEIAPYVRNGHVVVSDRYFASGLVIQRFDDVDPMFLWQINEEVERPDLAVILEADPDVIAERLETRGPHNRFQRSPGTSRRKVNYYHQVTETLEAADFNVLRVDCATKPPERSATVIYQELTELLDRRLAVVHANRERDHG